MPVFRRASTTRAGLASGTPYEMPHRMRFTLPAALLVLGLVFGCYPHYPPTYDVSSVQGLAVDPSDANTVLAVHGGAIERSTDGGRTWKVDASPNAVTALAWVGSLAWAIGQPVGSAQFTVLMSADTGLTWNATVSPLPSAVTNASTLDVDRMNDRHVVVVDAVPGVVPQVFVTQDAGATWRMSSLAPVPSYANPVVVAFDGMNGSDVWLGFPNLLHSTDGGLTFTGTATVVSGVVFDIAALGSSVFVATDSGLLASTDGGATFGRRTILNDTVFGVRIDSAAPSIVWAVGSTGIYRSTDGGAIFLLVSNAEFLASSAIAPSNGQVVYFGGVAGGASTTDGGATFVRFSPFDFAILIPIY
jgi:photosystem II stability/assembly factor-like uncharacterized protein